MPNTLEIRPSPIWDELEGRPILFSIGSEVTARRHLDCLHCYVEMARTGVEALQASNQGAH